jgi:hypothetical protein
MEGGRGEAVVFEAGSYVDRGDLLRIEELVVREFCND